jgi:hypothetical protein
MGCNGNVEAASRFNIAVDWFIFGENLKCDLVSPFHVELPLRLTIVRVFTCDSRVSIKSAFNQTERREKSGVFPGRWRLLLGERRSTLSRTQRMGIIRG